MNQNNINTEANLGKLLVSYDKACANLNKAMNDDFLREREREREREKNLA